MNYLTYRQANLKGLIEIKNMRCGSSDTVTYLQPSGVTYYILSENRALEYIGLLLVEYGKIEGEIFFQSEGEINTLMEDYGFHWELSAEEKADILERFIY